MPKGIGKIFVATALGLGLLAWFCPESCEDEVRRRPDYTPAELKAIADQGNALDQQVADRLRFRAVFAAARDQVLQDSDLRAATEKLRLAAAAQYPAFLTFLRRARLGPNDRERVALNLVEFLRLDHEGGGLSADSASVLARLQQELRSPSFRRWCSADR